MEGMKKKRKSSITFWLQIIFEGRCAEQWTHSEFCSGQTLAEFLVDLLSEQQGVIERVSFSSRIHVFEI
jgi:hypothetical protein